MKEELKIKDVMIGDWVDVRNNAEPNTPHLERITPSHFLRDEHWYGIELLPEILEKNGFVEMDSGYYRYFLAYDENYYAGFESVSFYPESYRINATKEECNGLQSQYKGKCVYLHQLQNILRDLGIEKEITI